MLTSGPNTRAPGRHKPGRDDTRDTFHSRAARCICFPKYKHRRLRQALGSDCGVVATCGTYASMQCCGSEIPTQKLPRNRPSSGHIDGSISIDAFACVAAPTEAARLLLIARTFALCIVYQDRRSRRSRGCREFAAIFEWSTVEWPV